MTAREMPAFGSVSINGHRLDAHGATAQEVAENIAAQARALGHVAVAREGGVLEFDVSQPSPISIALSGGDPPARWRHIGVRVTHEEHALISALAAAAGCTVSDLIRRSVLLAGVAMEGNAPKTVRAPVMLQGVRQLDFYSADLLGRPETLALFQGVPVIHQQRGVIGRVVKAALDGAAVVCEMEFAGDLPETDGGFSSAYGPVETQDRDGLPDGAMRVVVSLGRVDHVVAFGAMR